MDSYILDLPFLLSLSTVFFIICFSVWRKVYIQRCSISQFRATASMIGCGLRPAGFWLIAHPFSCLQWTYPLLVASQNTTGHIWQGGVPQGSCLGGERGCRSGVKSWGKAGWVKSWLENCNVSISRQAKEGLQFADAYLGLSLPSREMAYANQDHVSLAQEPSGVVYEREPGVWDGYLPPDWTNGNL